MRTMLRALLTVASLCLLAAPAAAHHMGAGDLSLGLVRATPGSLLAPASRSRSRQNMATATQAATGTVSTQTQGQVQGAGQTLGSTRPANPVPEPAAIAVFGAGALVTGFALRRRRR